MTSVLSHPAVRRLVGRRGDWQLRKPLLTTPHVGLHTIGPLVIVGSLVASWFAFANAQGEGSVAFGLFIGAVSILLMAWSFLLALRPKVLEPLFGGLDSMYRVHRWAGSLAVVAMFLHTSIEPDIKGGVRGASRSLANSAEDLAGVGQNMLYVLIGLSLIRWFPYRWWRLTHKLLGIPFVFACFHFFTATKPYANSSAWGWWFGLFMAGGVGSYLARVIGRDMIARGTSYRITKAQLRGSTLELAMAPLKAKLEHHAGQFAAIKIQQSGLSEPHIFTIASAPDDSELRFFIRNLGDWSAKLQARDLVDAEVLVEGPYGQFEPIDGDRSTVWVAGGVGITPFLSAMAELQPEDQAHRPTLFYCVRSVEDATALDEVRAAEADGRIDLVLCDSQAGTRFTAELLDSTVGQRGLGDAHVAVCGPAGLISTAEHSARRLGAKRIEKEDFDIRQGFGPDLSKDIDELVTSVTDKRANQLTGLR